MVKVGRVSFLIWLANDLFPGLSDFFAAYSFGVEKGYKCITFINKYVYKYIMHTCKFLGFNHSSSWNFLLNLSKCLLW